MSDPRFIDARLGAGDADPFERALLSSAKSDGMSADRKRALALALGAGAAAATVSAAGAAKAATAAGTAAAAKAKGAAGGLALVKWIVAAVAGGALVVGATRGAVNVYEAEVASSSTLARARANGKAIPPATRAPVAAAPAAAPAPAPIAEPAEPAAEETVAPAPAVAPAPPPAAAPARVAHSSPTPRPNPIADELRTIERARAALAAGDLDGARRALDDHDRAFARGALSEEAAVLRIDVLAQGGQRTRAEAAARTFLAAHPASPHAPRLRELLGPAGESP